MGKAYGNKTSQDKRPPERAGDHYETHYGLTELLLKKEDFDYEKKVIEPAAGKGAMVKVLQEKFNHLYSFDPHNGNYEVKEGKKKKYKTSINYNFLKEHFPLNFDGYIITNPPYSLADEFVWKAKEINPLKFCYLLRTNFLSGQKRLFHGVFDGLKKVLVFNRMPDLRAPIRPDGKFPTAMNVYAWFIWERGYTGKSIIDWLDCSQYVLAAREMESEYIKELERLEIKKPKRKEVQKIATKKIINN